MLSMLFWVSFGATVGWTAAILREEKGPRYICVLILMGAAGGLLGGLASILPDPAAAHQSTTTDSIFAIFGATFFVLLASRIVSKRSDQQKS